MKRYILFSILVAFCLIGKAQDVYYPFVDTTASWYFKQIVNNPYGADGIPTATYKKFYFKKDSLVDNIQYYRSYVDFKGFGDSTPLDFFYEKDSVVYGVSEYDFLNDTVKPSAVFDFTDVPVDRITYNGYSFNVYDGYTESIGYTNGWFPIFRAFWLIFNGESPEWVVNDYWIDPAILTCYERDGKIIYQDPRYSSCWPDDTTAIREIEDKYIVPSVLMGDVLVKTEGYDKLSLISVNGKVVLNEKLENAGLFELKTEELAPNMYWLILSDKNGNGIRQKVTVR